MDTLLSNAAFMWLEEQINIHGDIQPWDLLDATHFLGDEDETDRPVIQNRRSICKIHHAAFDKNIIGISPDYQVKVRQDILEETDGPMLKYGIQFLDNNKLILPRNRENWPDRERLYLRFNQFIKAC